MTTQTVAIEFLLAKRAPAWTASHARSARPRVQLVPALLQQVRFRQSTNGQPFHGAGHVLANFK